MNRYTLDTATAAAVRYAVKDSCPNYYNGLCSCSDRACYVLEREGGISCRFAWSEILPNYPELFSKIRTQYHAPTEK